MMNDNGGSNGHGNVDWDQLIENLIRQNYKPNWNYCDVGSCEGRFSKIFVELAGNGKVYAFDINNSNPKILGCINERMAISDKNDIEKVYDCGSHMSNILGHDTSYNITAYKEDIQSITLDTYFKDIPINCIKIDIEGAELKAIIGGIETIKNANLVIIECHLDEHWNDIYDILINNDMEFFELFTNEKITRDVSIGPRGIRPYQIYSIK